MLTRHMRRASWIAGATLAALLFFLGGAALRLMMGPISLGPFAGAIEDSLNRAISGFVIRFDRAVLEWSSSEAKVNLIVLGTKVFDADGRIVAQAPKADLDFDAANLVAGRLALKRFSLIGVQLTGVRDKEGHLKLGFGSSSGTPDLIATLTDILKSSESSGSSLQSFAVREARLAFSDEPSGLFIVSPKASLTLEERDQRQNAVFEASVEISGAPSTVRLTATLDDSGMPQSGTLDVRGLSLPALAENSAAFSGLAPYRLTSDVDADFMLLPDGKLTIPRLHAAGTGTIAPTLLDTPLDLRKFALDASYDAQTGRLAVTSLGIEGKQLTGKARADLVLAWKDSRLGSVTGEANAESLRLVFPALFPEPVGIGRVSFKGAYDAANQTLQLQRLSLRAGTASVELSGRAGLANLRSPRLQLSGTLEPMQLRDVLLLWPKTLAPGARRWIDENMLAGQLGPAKIEADIPAGVMGEADVPDNILALSFPLSGTTIRYIPGMTPVTNADADAVLRGNSFRATIRKGTVGPIALDRGDVTIGHIHVRGAPADIKVHAEGKVADVLTLIDEHPLNYPTRFGLDPKSTSGDASLDLAFVVPMRRDVTRDEIGIRVAAHARAMRVPLDAKLKLEAADADFDIDTRSLTARGKGAMSGVPMQFAWTENFGSDALSTRIDVSAVLDDTSRPVLGLSQPDWVKGRMPFTATLTGQRFHFSDVAVRADAKDASIVFDSLNLAKPAGRAADLTASLHFGDDGTIAVPELRLSSEGFDVHGALGLDKAHGFANASFTRVRAGTDNDFSAEIRPRAGGGLSVSLNGASLDATQLFAAKPDDKPVVADKESEAKTLRDPLSIEANVRRVALRDNFALSDVKFTASLEANERITGFSLDAQDSSGGKVTGRMSAVKEARSLSIDAANAGNFIHGFTGFSSIRNGTFSARVTLPGGAAHSDGTRYDGTVELANIVVTDQPFMARLFAAGSLDGPARLLKGDGIAISKFSAPFSMRDKQITIREGRLSGPAIGATFEGTLDRSTDRVDISGSLVPVYGLNSMLGALPVVGDLFVSKPGEGVFGLTYAMRGDLDEPTLIVNPLSVLTPGILRRIFEFSTPKDMQPAPQAQGSAPKLE